MTSTAKAAEAARRTLELRRARRCSRTRALADTDRFSGHRPRAVRRLHSILSCPPASSTSRTRTAISPSDRCNWAAAQRTSYLAATSVRCRRSRNPRGSYRRRVSGRATHESGAPGAEDTGGRFVAAAPGISSAVTRLCACSTRRRDSGKRCGWPDCRPPGCDARHVRRTRGCRCAVRAFWDHRLAHTFVQLRRYSSRHARRHPAGAGCGGPQPDLEARTNQTLWIARKLISTDAAPSC